MRRITAVLFAALLMTGCAYKKAEIQESVYTNRFELVERASTWVVVADRETGVMYAVSSGMYNMGTFTMLMDEDGNPLIYEGMSKEGAGNEQVQSR